MISFINSTMQLGVKQQTTLQRSDACLCNYIQKFYKLGRAGCSAEILQEDPPYSELSMRVVNLRNT
jgi:hypothetical protein